MALDPSIAMSGKTIDTATPLNAYADARTQNQLQQNQLTRQNVMDASTLKTQEAQRGLIGAQTGLTAQEAVKEQLANMTTRQQNQLKNTISGAMELKPYLDKGDIPGALQFLQHGDHHGDSEDVNAAIQMLQQGPEGLAQLNQHIAALLAVGDVWGITPSKPSFQEYNSMDPGSRQNFTSYESAAMGGKSPTMAMFSRLRADPQYKDVPDATLYQLAAKKFDNNTTLGADGTQQPIEGATDTKGALEGAGKTGEEGAAYEKKLADDASNGLMAHRTLMEMRQLSKGFDPGKLTPLKEKVGAWAEAVGFPPDQVNAALGNVSDMQALGKLTAQLAGQAIKNISSRPTQMEFATFLQNTANKEMTPEAFDKVLDFMDQTSEIPLQKQAEFEQWKKQKGNGAQKYGQFDAQWNQHINGDANAFIAQPNAVPATGAPAGAVPFDQYFQQ